METTVITALDPMDKSNFQFSIFNFQLKKAYTLIELLITISIIIIFSGISIAYYNNFTEEKKLENETQKLVDVLDLAKKKAAGAEDSSLCPNSGGPFGSQYGYTGYRVNIFSNSYSLSRCCTTATSNSCAQPQLINTYNNIPSNITFTSSQSNIQFKQLTSVINSSTLITITVRNTNLNKCRQITISPSGVIETTTNSTGC